MSFRVMESSNANVLNVKKGEPTMVVPAEETEKGLYFLSNLDQTNPWTVQTIYLFKASEEKGNELAAATIKDALSKVLVYYYPLAGRLTKGQDGDTRLYVDCTGEGVVFVEAETDTTIEEIKDITKLDEETRAKLVFDIQGSTNINGNPFIVAQVTKFKCGGFVLGLCMNHIMFDGVGAMEFVNSWGEVARGFPLSTPPILDRTILKARNPPKIEFHHIEYDVIEDISNTSALYEEEDMVYGSFLFDAERLEKLKRIAMEDGVLDKCTTFEALSALVWRAKARALKLVPEQDTKLLFVVDGRARIDPPLPKGYFGNAVTVTTCQSNSQELLDKPISYAIGLVQKSIKSVTNSYLRSGIDHYELNRSMASIASTVMIGPWIRLSFSSADFGWGEPIASGPVSLLLKEAILFLSLGDDSKTINVVLGFPVSSMKIFQEMMEI
ncbi:hypothetical protein MKW92_005163 [Papaver armeniacum]|nr:hypothetical protein MKW92_005163 [Papaver armeniacum]